MPIKSKITRIMAKVGASQTPAPASQGLYLYDNPDCVSVDTATTDIVPLRGSFTKTPSLIGRQLFSFSGKVFTDQHEIASSIRYHPLLLMCGLATNNPAANTSITYTPIGSGFSPSTIWVDYNGILYKLVDTLGTFTMTGAASEGVSIEFEGQSIYTVPAVLAAEFAAFSPGPSVIETFKGITASITPAGGSAYACPSLNLKSFTFTRGIEIAERTSACAANGLAGLDFSDATATLEVTVEMPADFSTNLGNWYSDLTASVLHSVSIQWGTAKRGIWKLVTPQAQVTQVQTPDGEAGNRNLVLSYRLTHSTDNSEFTLSVNHDT